MALPSPLDAIPIPPIVLNFFRSIKENPDDDAPRLIFADWLQERGDEAVAARGEYLRLCVLRHRLSSDDATYPLLKRREGELFRQYGWKWLGPLADAARSWTFERGMIQIAAQAENMVTPEVAAWARTEAALWIDALAVAAVQHDSARLLPYSPLLARVVRLDLSGNPIRTALQVFFRALRSQTLQHLTQLSLCRNRLTADDIANLAHCRHCRQLALLDLQHNRLDDAAAHHLAESPYLTNGTRLLLGRNRFTSDGLALLHQAFGDRVSF